MESHRYFMIHKPPGMLSQFIGPQPALMLGELNMTFPEGIHAIGRLDKESEGLLLLTTDKTITKLLFNSGVPHKRTYAVKVKYEVNAANLLRLQTGVRIRIRGGAHYQTPPCDVQVIDPAPEFPPAPGEAFDYDPVTWLRITLTEGRYHQVRKMVLAAGHRCRRLIRVSIENMQLGNLPPGGVREFSKEEFFGLLNL